MEVALYVFDVSSAGASLYERSPELQQLALNFLATILVVTVLKTTVYVPFT